MTSDSSCSDSLHYTLDNFPTHQEYPLTHDYSGGAGVKTMNPDMQVSGLPLYDVMGRKVSNPRKGDIYIQGGKKIIK